MSNLLKLRSVTLTSTTDGVPRLLTRILGFKPTQSADGRPGQLEIITHDIQGAERFLEGSVFHVGATFAATDLAGRRDTYFSMIVTFNRATFKQGYHPTAQIILQPVVQFETSLVLAPSPYRRFDFDEPSMAPQ